MKDGIIISIQKPHTENIHKMLKRAELRKSIPKALIASAGYPITCFMYESKKNGGAGKVVGYFTLDKIDVVTECRPEYCITPEYLKRYAAGKTVYAWNITQSAFYASPRPLSDFGLTRAPQSWCYIKEVG